MTPDQFRTEVGHNIDGMRDLAQRLVALGVTDPRVVRAAQINLYSMSADERIVRQRELWHPIILKSDPRLRNQLAPLVTAPAIPPPNLPQRRLEALRLAQQVKAKYAAGFQKLSTSEAFRTSPQYRERLTRAVRAIAGVPIWFHKKKPAWTNSQDVGLPWPISVQLADDDLIEDTNDIEMIIAHEFGHIYDSQMNPELFRAEGATNTQVFDPKGNKVNGRRWDASHLEERADHFAQQFLQRTGTFHPEAKPASLGLVTSGGGFYSVS
jgi:hypothetical protein